MERGKRRKYKKYDLEERLVSFAVQIINMVEKLPRSCAGLHISN